MLFLLHLEIGPEGSFSTVTRPYASWCTLLDMGCHFKTGGKGLLLAGEMCCNPAFLDFFKTEFVFVSLSGERCFLFRGITPAQGLQRSLIHCFSRKNLSCGVSDGFWKAGPFQVESPEIDFHFWFCHRLSMWIFYTLFSALNGKIISGASTISRPFYLSAAIINLHTS